MAARAPSAAAAAGSRRASAAASGMDRKEAGRDNANMTALPTPSPAPPLVADPENRRPQQERPQSLTDLFVSFTLLALQGFGGVLAIVQRELVERKRWL